ncbi:hypothetical protein BE221DRAFT_81405 [Ostreococcus tauri]|uniref:Uncharacterized protein n=1 Tax=Ostreococcus tauri TaxID=70448 RepID=A0A1Y5I7L8_OSTTA|nr:hypothetical protein BE221DRAFT_81405 [Ostreococcus tauri]
MRALDRGDAPPFDRERFNADVVVPSDQRVALERVPGWSSTSSRAEVRRARAREGGCVFNFSIF